MLIAAQRFSALPRVAFTRHLFGRPYKYRRGTRTGAGGISSLSSIDLEDNDPVLAYELLQGPLVRWSKPGAGVIPPTMVLVHGILGSRRNMQSFARMLLEGFPSWQILLVDLRCHGDSVDLPSSSQQQQGPNTVHSAASDILTLLRNLKLFPQALIGHSFGGKVVLGMVKQFAGAGARLPRPVQVWVLDSLPGEVRAGDNDGNNHPARLIDMLRDLPLPIPSRSYVVKHLTNTGFSMEIAQWAASNLRPANGVHGVSSSALSWIFDLDGIKELYRSYEEVDMYSILEHPPEGIKIDFIKAERSTFRWGGKDEDRILASGHRVHLLKNSGHWVHTERPMELFDIMSPSFGAVDLHQRRTMAPR